MNVDEIEKQAKELIKKANCENQYPISLTNIADYLQYDISWFMPNDNTQDVSGAVDHVEKRIYINKAHAAGRQQFTLAHEIGHIILTQENGGNRTLSPHIDYRAEELKTKDESERQADYFAANLLMPKDKFREKWLEYEGDLLLEKISKLSTFFGTSVVATAVRTESLGYK